MQKLSLALLCILSGMNLLAMNVDKELGSGYGINGNGYVSISSIPGNKERLEVNFGYNDRADDKTVKNPLRENEKIEIVIPSAVYSEGCGLHVSHVCIITNENRPIFLEKILNATKYKGKIPHYTLNPDTKKLTLTQILENQSDYEIFAQWLEVSKSVYDKNLKPIPFTRNKHVVTFVTSVIRTLVNNQSMVIENNK